jgi:hypothetical protein
VRARTALADKPRNCRRAIAAVVGLDLRLEQGWDSIEDMMIVLELCSGNKNYPASCRTANCINSYKILLLRRGFRQQLEILGIFCFDSALIF